jgi:hypothetical protein
MIRKYLLLEYVHYRLMEALNHKMYNRAKVLINRKNRIKNL